MASHKRMIWELKSAYGLNAPKVFSAMLQVPREKFTSQIYRKVAYHDRPIPIGHNQTMSQPYTVAFMTYLLVGDGHKVRSDNVSNWKILEIGTGSGYQAAVLSLLTKRVYSVEIIKDLANKARKRLDKLGFDNIKIKSGKGEKGWPEYAPYDAIMITAGISREVSQVLFSQLKEGGILVAPVGKGSSQTMMRYKKTPLRPGLTAGKAGLRGASKKYKIEKEKHGVFHFVPFVES